VSKKGAFPTFEDAIINKPDLTLYYNIPTDSAQKQQPRADWRPPHEIKHWNSYGTLIKSFRTSRLSLRRSLRGLARTSHRPFTAAAEPGAFTALRFLGLLDILTSMPAGPFVARG